MGQETRTAGNEPKYFPGPYIGRVVGHLDPNYMGAIEVELIKLSTSSNQGLDGQTVKVKYGGPFVGQTPATGLTKNQGHKYTQQAYGFWMTPPDIGTRVIVVFIEGQVNMGFWIGCIQDNYINFSMPDRVATTHYTGSPETKGSVDSIFYTGKAVVGEINKKNLEDNKGNDPTKFKKPINEDWMEILGQQGLASDGVRGLSTASARREVPSMVFGISTPGPYDKRPGYQKAKYGTAGTQADIPFGRLGGTHFVMDDGDDKFLRKGFATNTKKEYANVGKGDTSGRADLPANELMRIRTRTGHQILFHNTEDLVRIDHGSGNSWIEMSANGKIDVYAKDSISMHTENDLNITADRDINLQAGRSFNLLTNFGINLETTTSIQSLAGLSTNITSGTTSNISSGLGHFETALQIHMNGPEAAKTTPLSTHVVPGATATAVASLHKRLPQHEPWGHHENVDPEQYSPEQTDRTNDVEIPSAPDIDTIPDTFKKDGA
jgi:hypothetical protein